MFPPNDPTGMLAQMTPIPMGAPPAGPQQAMDPSMAAPQGQNYISQENEVDEREGAFENAFKDTAYNIFSTRHPTMVPSIVTFKVIKSTIDEGDAVGAFILNLQGETLYVPIIMADNQMKPMEIVYSKRMDKFLPFTRDWISAVVSSNTEPMGESVSAPPYLEADKDITPLMRPPLYGRTGYAEDLSAVNHLEIIKQASNEAKTAFKNLLKNNKAYLKFAFEHFPEKDIRDALALRKVTEKTASVPVKLEVVDMDTPAAEVKELFGNQAQEAMKDMARSGFAYKDDRSNLNKVTSTTDCLLKLEEPGSSGVYTIFDTDGSTYPALVIVNPEPLLQWDMDLAPCGTNPEMETYTFGDWSKHPIKRKNYMVIKTNGDFFYTDELVAGPSNRDEFTGDVANVVFGDKRQNSLTPANLCFIKIEGDIIAGTKSHYFDRTEVGSDGNRKFLKTDEFADKGPQYIGDVKTERPHIRQTVVHSQTPTGKVLMPKNAWVSVVPKTYKVVKLGDCLTETTHFSSARDILEFVQRKMNMNGGRTVKLANIGGGEFAIDGIPAGQLKEAAVSLATNYHVAMKTVMREFSKLATTGDYTKILIMPHEKRASIFAAGTDGTQMSPQAIQQMYGAGQGMPPMEQGMDPSQQAAMGGMPVETPSSAMMDIGVNTNDPEIYNVGALNSLSQYQDIQELLAVYSPTLEKALDNTGRMLLTFWIRGRKAVDDLGVDTYFSTEESLRTVFKELGQLLIRLNQRSAAMPATTDY